MPADVLIRRLDRILTTSDLPRDADAMALDRGRIAWIGPTSEAPAGREEIDGLGLVAAPGLVDAHTHAVFAGDRSAEWALRVAGAHYTEILERGGGILSTVAATRAAPTGSLVDLATRRLSLLRARGVTTVEVKSGYGLTVADEVRMLEVAVEAGERADVAVLPTLLGAHTVPAEWRHDRARYVDQVVDEQIPAVRGLARFVDVYVDRGAFTLDEARRILEAGVRAGLTPRVHAEQVTHTGAAALAAELGASSADHLERLDEAGAAAMGAAGTVAVLLPFAQVTLRDPAPPVALLRRYGVPIAVATDLNPGTSACYDPWLAGALGCLAAGLTPDESLTGLTRNGARALRLDDRGALAVGLRADVALVERAPGAEPTPAGLLQHASALTVRRVLRAP
jgi:imidazolonepropionase